MNDKSRLEELKQYTVAVATGADLFGDTEVVQISRDITALIDDAIARLDSTVARCVIPTVDEVAKVTGWMVEMREGLGIDQNDQDRLLKKLLAALSQQDSTVVSEDVEAAIITKCYDKLYVAIGYVEALDDSGDWQQALDTLKEYALRAYRPEPDCATAEWAGGKCCGYGKAENDDEPIDACKSCLKQASYGIE